MGSQLERYLYGAPKEAPKSQLEEWLHSNAQRQAFRQQLSSAKGRSMFLRQTEPEEAKRLLKDYLDDPETPEPQKEDFTKMLELLDSPHREGILGTAQDLALGVAEGVAKTPFQLADLALTIPDLAARGINKLGGDGENIFRDARGAVQEVAAQIGEDIDGRGIAGGVGEFAGGLAGGVLPYGKVAQLAGKAITGVAPASSVGRAITAATGPGASLGQKVVANVATGAPINIAQGASMDDASLGERGLQLGIGTAADALFPMASPSARAALERLGLKKATEALKQTEVATKETKGADLPVIREANVLPEARAQEVAAKAEAARKGEATQKADQDAKKADAEEYKVETLRAKSEAAQEWKAANPGKEWDKLTKPQRAVVYNNYIVRNKENWTSGKMAQKVSELEEVMGPVANSNLNQTPVPEAPPTTDLPGNVPVEGIPQAPPVASPLKSVHIDRSLNDMLALSPTDAPAVFKSLKLPYDPGESILDNLKSAIQLVEAGDPTSKAVREDLKLLSLKTRELRAAEQAAIASQPAIGSLVEQGKIKSANIELGRPPAITQPPPELDPKQARQWFKRSFDQFKNDELDVFEQWLDDRVTGLDMQTGEPYRQRMHELLEWRAQKKRGEELRVIGETPQASEFYAPGNKEREQFEFNVRNSFIRTDVPIVPVPFARTPVAVRFVDAVQPELERALAQSNTLKVSSSVVSNIHKLIHNKLFGTGAGGTSDTYKIRTADFGGWIFQKHLHGLQVPENYANTGNYRQILYNPSQIIHLGTNTKEAADRWWGVIGHELSHTGGAKDVTAEFEDTFTFLMGDIADVYQKVAPDLEHTVALMKSREFTQLLSEYRRSRDATKSQFQGFGQGELPSASMGRSVNSGNGSPQLQRTLAGGGETNASAGSTGDAGLQGGSGLLAKPRTPGDVSPATRIPDRKDASYIRAGVSGGATGFVFGLLATDKDDENYWAKVAMWSAIGAGGTLVTKNLWSRTQSPVKPPSLIPNTADLDSRVVNIEDEVGRQVPTMARLRQFYQETVRSTFEVDWTYKKMGLDKLPAQLNASKLMQTWGRHVAMIEGWLTRGPTYVDNNGQVITMMGDDGQPLKPLNRILTETAQGAKTDLGKLMVARTSLELAATGRKTPMSINEAERVLSNAPEFLHQAADEMRQYHKGLLRVMVMSGRISQEAFAKMSSEEWYAPLRRILGDVDRGLQMKGESIKPTRDIYGRKKQGSRTVVRNPYDETVDMTARILKSAEMNNVINTMWQNSRMAPGGAGDLWMKRGENRSNVGAQKVRAKAEALSKELRISQEDAEGILSFMDESITVAEGADKTYMLTGYDQGKTVTYQIPEGFYTAYRAMRPMETKLLLQIISAPARLGAAGVVHNPMFAGTQFFIDTFHAMTTSEYGFRPFIDSLRGFLAVARNTPAYQALINAGGPGTVQSLKYTGELEKAVKAVAQAGKTPLETAVHQFKEYDAVGALKTIMLPFAEAARVGEYLRALDHGESVLEATYAAWNVMGNVKLQGASNYMRAFNMMTMFSRPAISGLDEVVYRTGLPHPRRGMKPDLGQMSKFLFFGTAGITLPSILLWMANKDDEELNMLRRTESGQRYWWARNWKGEPMKLRKPHVVGQIFGTMAENALDKMYDQDPQGTTNWLSGMFDDAFINMIPTVGVVPLAVAFDKVPGIGGNLVPNSQGGLEPSLWGADKASLPARVVSEKALAAWPDKLTPGWLERFMSPAAIDLSMRTIGGMWGEDGMKAIGYAHEWMSQDAPPPMAEAPIIGRLFSKYPTSNVGPIRMFYNVAEMVDRKANTVARYSTSNPAKLVSYMPEAMPYLAIAETYNKSRGEMNKLWRAINDFRAMPDDILPPADKRRMEDAFIQQIIMHARTANLMGQAVLKAK